jgi:hypothetical protein
MSCAEAGLQAVARALADATAVPENEDLAAFAGTLAASIPEVQPLAAELALLSGVVSLEDAPGEPDISALFARVDAWILAAAEFCQRRDPTLVLRDALPRAATGPQLQAAALAI